MLAALVSACSGTLPGLEPETPASPVRQTSPGVATRTVLQEGVAPRPTTPSGYGSIPAAAMPGGAGPSASIGTQPYTAIPPQGGAVPSSPPPMTSFDPRDKQLELLTEAVAALRQEVARSYEHSQVLTQENEKLRSVIASLRRELAKEKGGSKALKEHLQSLENRMRELQPPPLEPPTRPNRAAPPPAAAAPSAPSSPGTDASAPPPPQAPGEPGPGDNEARAPDGE